MRILTCAFYYYYNDPKGIEPQFYYLYKVPESLGYDVDFFDYGTASKVGIEQMRRIFLSIVKGGNYDAVFIATHEDEFDQETLGVAREYCPIIGWNSDDEWRWDKYSRARVNWYSYMVTNSSEIYEKNKDLFAGLLHAQWACTGFWDGRKAAKDIDFSFVGQVYGSRASDIQWLSKHAKLQAFGKGTRNLTRPGRARNLKSVLKNRLIKEITRFLPKGILDELSIVDFEQVNMLWNRSKISFTPLESYQERGLQIKSRVFDMGLSGTLMLAQRNPHLDVYYEPEKEYVSYAHLEECLDKVKFYLKHDTARIRISKAYAERTEAEHLWKYRIQHVLKEAGILKKS